MKGLITEAEDKTTSQGKPYKRLNIETDNGKRWYSAFENPAVEAGWEVEFEAVKNGAFWNALGVTPLKKIGRLPKEESIGSNREEDIHYSVCLKISADLAIAAFNKTGDASHLTNVNIVKVAADLQKEAWGD